MLRAERDAEQRAEQDPRLVTIPFQPRLLKSLLERAEKQRLVTVTPTTR